MSFPLVVGIDPGLKGALARAPFDGDPWAVLDMPTEPNGGGMVKQRVNCASLSRILEQWFDPNAVCVIEDVQPFGNNGAVGMFSLGQSLGAVRGVAAAIGYKVVLVRPQTWKKDLGLSRDKGDSLARAIKAAPALAPHLKRKKDEGRAEAALLACWYIAKFML